MYSNVIVPRQWTRFACLCRSLTSVEGQKLPQSSKSSDGISPPPRKPRGPTDILQALAATVGTDPTAPHYNSKKKTVPKTCSKITACSTGTKDSSTATDSEIVPSSIQ